MWEVIWRSDCEVAMELKLVMTSGGKKKRFRSLFVPVDTINLLTWSDFLYLKSHHVGFGGPLVGAVCTSWFLNSLCKMKTLLYFFFLYLCSAAAASHSKLPWNSQMPIFPESTGFISLICWLMSKYDSDLVAECRPAGLLGRLRPPGGLFLVPGSKSR